VPLLFFVLCGLVLAADSVLLGAFTPLVPHYKDEFGLGNVEAGLLVAAFPAGAALTALPGGLLPGAIGAKATLLGGLALLAAASLWFGVLSTPWELGVTRALQGVGSTIAWIGTFTWLVSRESASGRGELIGRAYSMSMLGSLVGPSLAIAVISAGSVPTFTTVAAVFGALLLAFAWIPGLRTRPPGSGVKNRTLARNAGVVIGALLLALQSVAFGALSVLAPLRLSDLGFSTSAISMVYVATAALVIVVNPLSGRWTDRRGHRTPVMYILAGSAAAVTVLAWAETAWVFAALLVATEVALFGLSAPASALVTDAVEASSVGVGMAWAVILLAWAPPNMLGALAGGVLRETGHVPYLILGVSCLAVLGLLTRRSEGLLS
jgi:ACDE family multidrug resistance protein